MRKHRLATVGCGVVDHYRLFEALAAGPLVVADLMLAPPKGLVDRENIVFFRTVEELPQIWEYYLTHEQERIAIANRGWELSYTRHRAWHRMEELLFGQPLTKGP